MESTRTLETGRRVIRGPGGALRMPFSHLPGGLKSPRHCTGGFTLNEFTVSGFTVNGFTLNGFTVNPSRLRVNGFTPLVDGLRRGRSRKSFRMRRYEKCACKCLGIRTYKNKGLKLPWNEQLQKNPVGTPSLPLCLPCLCLLVALNSDVAGLLRCRPWAWVAARIIRFTQPGQEKNNTQQHGEMLPMPPRGWPKSAWRHRLSAFACV